MNEQPQNDHQNQNHAQEAAGGDLRQYSDALANADAIDESLKKECLKAKSCRRLENKKKPDTMFHIDEILSKQDALLARLLSACISIEGSIEMLKEGVWTIYD
ncbi:hypothetical protein Fmac_017396 [Flemingia macrophylla]|uniref:Uncharacterized protein n=1 Tax=Flemingia macrophylla TaxID=520843 RepID=A0ABD1M207_9FABA